MITKVLKTIEAYQMLSPDSAVVAGVSGGADSMAFFTFCRAGERTGRS